MDIDGGKLLIAGAVLATGIGSVVFAEHMAGRDPLRCNERNYTAQPSSNRPSVTARTIETAYQAPNCAVPKDDKQDDLCQQRRMAQAADEAACIARWQFWISLFGLGGLLGTIIYAAKSARAASEAARETAHSVEVQIRSEGPILYVEDIVGGPGVGSVIHPVIKNTGKTPAILIESFTASRFGTVTLGAVPAYGDGRSLRREILDREQKKPLFVDDSDGKSGKDEGTAVVWGYILYEDFFGKLWRRGFGFKSEYIYVDDTGGEHPMWVVDGGKTYNYDREEKT